MPCMRAALRVLCVLVAALGGWAGVISLWPMRGASDAVAKARACGASGCPRPKVDTRLRRRVAMAAAAGRVLRAGLDTPAGTLARRSGASVWVQFVAMVFCTHVRCLLLPLSLTAFGAARLAGEGGRGGSSGWARGVVAASSQTRQPWASWPRSSGLRKSRTAFLICVAVSAGGHMLARASIWRTAACSAAAKSIAALIHVAERPSGEGEGVADSAHGAQRTASTIRLCFVSVAAGDSRRSACASNALRDSSATWHSSAHAAKGSARGVTSSFDRVGVGSLCAN